MLGVLLSVVGCTLLGIIVERLAYKPLRNAPSLNVLITAIGVSYFLQNAALLIMGSDPKSFSSIISLPAINLFDGSLTISATAVITILACVVIMLALTTFTNKTKMGKAMRACSEDREAAQLMGINVNSTISMVFAIGSGLAAIAGVLMCSAYPTLMPTTGSMPGIKAFTAAVFWRHWLYSRSCFGRYFVGHHRDFCSRLYWYASGRCSCFCGSNCDFAHQTFWPSGQSSSREGIGGEADEKNSLSRKRGLLLLHMPLSLARLFS